ncbi:DUF7504 family protein [Natrinema amylolyticum]|uniref:DUF7504 family protein n=1 Tax=Natrinema amylolyticum TaxID=2878679 RepID=UPI001CFA9353|nr:hypothetical protein [Natrinema amylolyticum]
MEPSTPAAIDPPANVLLVHSRREASAACEELCRDGGGTAHLTVTFADEEPDPPDAETVDGKHGLLTVGSGPTDDTESVPDFTDPVATDSVADPTDLSEIGVAISRFCKQWAEAGDDITVCFDSLDALLRHASPDDVFQFAHVLTNRLSSVGAHTHCHFDPTRHEDRVVSTFGSIFDAVVADPDDDDADDGDADDDDTDDSNGEATDEDVASLLAEWDEEPTTELASDPEPVSEATDEEIARTLGK